jgi:signal transduction histidine kinase
MTHRWSLRTRFVLFALACLLPLVLVAWFFLDRSNERNTEQLVNNEQTIVNIVDRSLRTYLTDTTTALATMGQQQAVTEAISTFDDTSAAKSWLGQARLVRKDLNGLFVVNDRMSLVTSSGIDVAPLLTSIEPQLKQTIENGQTTFSERLTLSDGSSAIMVIVPITAEVEVAVDSGKAPATNTSMPSDSLATGQPDPNQALLTQTDNKPAGDTIGAIGAIIQTTNLDPRVIPFASGKTEIAITNGDDVLVSTSGIAQDPAAFLTGQSDIISRALAGKTGGFTNTDSTDTHPQGVYGAVHFQGIEWAIFVSSPTPRTYASTLYMQGTIVLALAATIILALAVVFGELTARPLRELARKADALQRGDFSTDVHPVGSGEIRVLSQAFADMSRQLLAQLNGLEESRHEREHQTVQMRDLLRRTLRLQEDERRRIAGEIHDAVSPLITGALYQARALQMTNGKTPPEERDESLGHVNSLLERASDELHGVIFDLRPPDLDDLGVVAAIEAYMQSFKQTGLACRLVVENEPTDLSSEVRLGIYRIVQEALHNVVRHSGADEAVVRLETIDDHTRVTIRDNGSGFDPATAIRPTSLGLLSMRERADAIGATFQIVSRPGGGTAIIIDRVNTGNVMSDDVLATLIRELEPEFASSGFDTGDPESETDRNAGA